MTLGEVAADLSRRLAGLFLPDDGGRGLGASFQGWTTLVARCLEDLGRERGRAAAR
jgi:hypothetical protein